MSEELSVSASTYQIDHLNIRAFRRLVDVNLERLGRVNLLVGANNSGKTTVLEAIAAYCCPLDPLAWLSIARRREIKSSREPVLDALRWLFPQDGAEQEDDYFQGEVRVGGGGEYRNIESGAEFQGILGEIEEEESSSYSHEDENGEYDDEDESSSSEYDDDGLDNNVEESSSLGLQLRRGAEIRLFAKLREQNLFGGETTTHETRFQLWENERFVSRSAPPDIRLPVETVSPFSHRVEPMQVKLLTGATFSNMKKAILELIRHLDPEIEDLEILSQEGIRPTLYLKHRRTGYTPLSVLGEGVRRALVMGLSLVAAKNGVLLIDEIETAIHNEALQRVFGWLVRACVEHNVQLFATTHSLEAVDAILGSKQIDLDELNGYRLEAKDHRISAKRCSGDLLHRLRYERALDVR